MSDVTRGFRGRPRPEHPGRLPPGQYDAGADWPVLTAEPTPQLAAQDWTMAVDGMVESPSSWTWEEAHRLPSAGYHGDIHCVTTWSRFDMDFSGVSVDVLLAAARPLPSATHVLVHSHTGYTTNLPLEDIRGGRAWVVWEVDGQPLPPEHGGPARLLVPHLYFWKSAKWVSRLQLLGADEPGFWERLGYHNHGDPWREERYDGD